MNLILNMKRILQYNIEHPKQLMDTLNCKCFTFSCKILKTSSSCHVGQPWTERNPFKCWVLIQCTSSTHHMKMRIECDNLKLNMTKRMLMTRNLGVGSARQHTGSWPAPAFEDTIYRPRSGADPLAQNLKYAATLLACW